MPPSVLWPPAIVPATAPAARGPHSTTPARHGDRLDVLLDPWPCPADADAHLRSVAAAWTTFPGHACSVEATAETIVRPEDAAAAAALGARLRHVGTVERCGASVRSWRGVAAVPAGHLLASVPNGHWAAVIGAGSGHGVLVAAPAASAPDAAALVARAADAWLLRPGVAADADTPPPAPGARSWLVRLGFAHAVPPPAFVQTLLAGVGLHVRQQRMTPASSSATVCWAGVSAPGPAAVAQAIAVLHRVHRIAGHSWVVL